MRTFEERRPHIDAMTKSEPETQDVFTGKALIDSTAKIHYGRDREEYAKWIQRESPSSARIYISKLNRYLWGKKANTPEELRRIVESISPTKNGFPDRHAYLAIRSYINFLVATGRIRKSEAIDFKAVIPNIKTKARPESAKVISAEDIREILKDVKASKPEVVHARKLYLKLLAFTGLRADEVRELMNQFDLRVIDDTFKAFGIPEEWKEKIAVYDMERVKLPHRKHQTKRGYIAVFPVELVEDLKRFKASGYRMRKDNTYKRTMLEHPEQHKDLALFRKFFQNFMNDNVMSTVPNPPADAMHLIEFLQGRAPKNVGGRNYRWNVQNAARIYYYMVDKLEKELGILEL
ncbi:integrase [Thermococcus sp. JdF3]|uniref:integrase n=1 Tax=Thermococcus sp. JdF3 TaxID=1638258 RepID=UPI00143AAFF2|nr:integrase [Thermococcus sp. JdF3]